MALQEFFKGLICFSFYFDLHNFLSIFPLTFIGGVGDCPTIVMAPRSVSLFCALSVNHIQPQTAAVTNDRLASVQY